MQWRKIKTVCRSETRRILRTLTGVVLLFHIFPGLHDCSLCALSWISATLGLCSSSTASTPLLCHPDCEFRLESAINFAFRWPACFITCPTSIVRMQEPIAACICCTLFFGITLTALSCSSGYSIDENIYRSLRKVNVQKVLNVAKAKSANSKLGAQFFRFSIFLVIYITTVVMQVSGLPCTSCLPPSLAHALASMRTNLPSRLRKSCRTFLCC